MLIPNGLYVLVKGKNLVLADICSIEKSFNKVLSDGQAMSECRACREKIMRLLKNDFVDTHAKRKAVNYLLSIRIDNAYDARNIGNYLSVFLSDLKFVVKYSIHFDDLPSCRKILDFSPEEAAKKAIDLVANGIVKALFKAASIGENIYQFKEIEDVRRYYFDMLSGIQNDSIEDDQLSSVELVYENKCKEELEYCKLASLKLAGKLTNDILDEGRVLAAEYEKIHRRYSSVDIKVQ